MKVLQKIYAVWAIATLIITGVLCALLLLPGRIAGSRRGRLLYNQRILRGWSFVWAFLAGFSIRKTGKTDGEGPVILVMNHNSYLDPVTTYRNIRRPFRTLAKKELTKIPIYKYIVEASCILVDRKSAESRKASVLRMHEALEVGESILIYPEGTQNRTSEPLKEFYDGAFRLAIETGTPLQVIASINARNLLPQGKMMEMRPGRITLRWLDRIETSGMTMADLPDLKEQVRDLLETEIRVHDPAFRT